MAKMKSPISTGNKSAPGAPTQATLDSTKTRQRYVIGTSGVTKGKKK